jgi:transcriptional regulator with XRE-family HTH domain
MKIVDGSKIKALREAKKLDQYELAKAAGVVPSVISRLERNLQGDFKLSVIVSVARVLGVNIDSLLYESTLKSVTLEPELQIVINEVATLSTNIQKQVAGILRGYLLTLDNNVSDQNK